MIQGPPDRPDRIERLEAAIAGLQERVRLLESAAGVIAPTPATEAPTPVPATVAGPESIAAAAPLPEEPLLPEAWQGTAGIGVGLVGRTLVALGGAYLLRAFTEGGVLAPAVGIACGLAYATLLLFLADRDARRGRPGGATFHGVTAMLIAFPLVTEAALRFKVLPPSAAGLVIVGALAAGLVVAGLRALPIVAWAASLGAVGTTLTLLVATRELVVFTTTALAIVAVVEPFARRRSGVRWVTALSADVAVLTTVWLTARGLPESYPPVDAATVTTLALALALLSLAATAWRAAGAADLAVVDDVQAVLAVAIGFGGAVRVLEAGGGSGSGVGMLAALLAIAAYAAAFAKLENGAARTFYHYATLGAVLLIAGGALLLGAGASTAFWSTLALLSTWLGGRWDRRTLASHGVAYAAAAALGSGLLRCAKDGLVASASDPWCALSPSVLVALGACGATWFMLDAGRRRTEGRWPGLWPITAISIVVGFALAGLASRLLAIAWASAPGPTADLAFAAAARTLVLAALAIVVGWLGRERPELRTLAWVVLAGAGLKLLVEDLPHGRPASLFVAFAAYGGALIVASRRVARNVEAP